MEFLAYSELVESLNSYGVVESPAGDVMRFDVKADEDKALEPARVLIRVAGVEKPEGLPETLGEKEIDAERFAGMVEELCHITHVGDLAIVPAKTWGSILDVAAFDLASDETWLEVDAEVSLHQNRRDPLALTPESREIVTTITKALREHGEGEAQDMSVLPIEATVVFDVRCAGVILVTCGNRATAENILSSL
ncbi:MAG: hypothetical protein AAGD00_09755 [Planctomycetota bacterium]